MFRSVVLVPLVSLFLSPAQAGEPPAAAPAARDQVHQAIERSLVFPLANLVATGQVKLGDFVRIDMASGDRMIFVKEAENAMAPVLLERYGAAAANQPSARGARAAATGRRDFGAPSPGLAESK